MKLHIDNNIKVFIPRYLCDNFEAEMEDNYINGNRQTTKRGFKLAKTITSIKDSPHKNSSQEDLELSESLVSNEWENSSEDYEGGEVRKGFESPNNLEKDEESKSFNKNIPFIDNSPDIKHQYSKVKSKDTIMREKKEEYEASLAFNKACDAYFEENTILFDYQDYDESLEKDQPREKNPDLYYNYDVNGVRVDQFITPKIVEENEFIREEEAVDYKSLSSI